MDHKTEAKLLISKVQDHQEELYDIFLQAQKYGWSKEQVRANIDQKVFNAVNAGYDLGREIERNQHPHVD